MNYRQALSQPVLGAEEELALIQKWKDEGDIPARDKLIACHMRICFSVAARWEKNEERIRDLAQEGVFGLMRALEKFDPSFGSRFATYARHWVKNSIGDCLSEVSAVVDIAPRTYRQARAMAEFTEQDAGGITWSAWQASRGEIPLDAPVGEADDLTLAETLPDKAPSPEQGAMRSNKLAIIRAALDKALAGGMSEREADILRRRALTERPETLEHIAAGMGISRERVRQVEASAMRKLKKHLLLQRFPRQLLEEDSG